MIHLWYIEWRVLVCFWYVIFLKYIFWKLVAFAWDINTSWNDFDVLWSCNILHNYQVQILIVACQILGIDHFLHRKKYLLIYPFFKIFVQLYVFMIHREPFNIFKKNWFDQIVMLLIGNNALVSIYCAKYLHLHVWIYCIFVPWLHCNDHKCPCNYP